MLKTGCATLALSVMAFTNPALAACAGSSDVAALKTAVLQQELMVAAFQCHEAAAYNGFVTAYRGELQASDAALKSFFIRRGGEHGEAGYDSFKTKAANLSGLEQARDSRAFCADAHALFAGIARNDGSLAQFVAQRSAPLDVGGVCQESRPMTAVARPVIARAPAAVRVADARPSAISEAAIGGVPDHALPVRPFRNAEADAQEVDDAQPQDLPPPRPRAMAVREDREDYGDQDRTPPPPPRWQRQAWRDYPPPPPAPRWYPRDPYYGW